MSCFLMSTYQLRYLDKIPDHAVVNEASEIVKSVKRQWKIGQCYLTPLSCVKVWPDIPASNEKQTWFYCLFPSSLVSCQAQGRIWRRASTSHLWKSSGAQQSQHSCDRFKSKRKSKSCWRPVIHLCLFWSRQGAGAFCRPWPFFRGAITIQDESSQLVAPTLDLQGDEQVLDACAAPGGKTAHIASYLTTGQVTALDLYDHKLDLIQENAERLGVADRVQTQKLDARKVHEFLVRIHLIRFLVDAPCSGIGLLRRKPVTSNTIKKR